MGRTPRSLRLAAFVYFPAAFLACGFVSADEAAPDPATALADRIDAHIFGVLEREGIVPAPAADDAEFFRRAWLDIAGKIPPVMDVRDFLADQAPGKRRRAIDRLLESPGYISHFAAVWREAMIPEANTDRQLQFRTTSFDAWLRQKLADDTAYDMLVDEILTAPLSGAAAQGPFGAMSLGGPSPAAFYYAKQGLPENLAASTARTFLGVRIECAQCHDHPFDSWRREQFWSFAAFFAGLERQDRANVLTAIREAPASTGIAIPGADKVVPAEFLDGRRPSGARDDVGRIALTRWITSPDNPYFARAAVNRLWAHFFGVGLVEPADDFSENNPASHPELLEELAGEFVSQGFDLKFLIRGITSSRAYQLSSRRTHPSQDAPQRFARMSVKGLTAAQMFDSLAQATGFVAEQVPQTPAVAFPRINARAELLEIFSNDAEPPVQRQTTIAQALALMNGSLTAQAVNLKDSRTLLAVVEFPMRPAQRVEAIYLATLSRPPREDELERLTLYVMDGGPTNDPDRALADVFWALLNSSEFATNH
jgi:hypothetical protein